jgi:hypothetical protein
MKIKSLVLALSLSAAFFSSCATKPVKHMGYTQSQFSSRLEYLRFCQQYDPHGRHCN